MAKDYVGGKCWSVFIQKSYLGIYPSVRVIMCWALIVPIFMPGWCMCPVLICPLCISPHDQSLVGEVPTCMQHWCLVSVSALCCAHCIKDSFLPLLGLGKMYVLIEEPCCTIWMLCKCLMCKLLLMELYISTVLCVTLLIKKLLSLQALGLLFKST